MKTKNKNLEVPFVVTSFIFIIAFIGSLIILPEIQIFGVGSPETSPEPMTYAGGLISYAFLVAVIISLLVFFLFSFYYDLRIFGYAFGIIILGLVGSIISYVLLQSFFDVTNFFVVLHIPPIIQVYNCSSACIQEVNGFLYSNNELL